MSVYQKSQPNEDIMDLNSSQIWFREMEERDNEKLSKPEESSLFTKVSVKSAIEHSHGM